MRFSRLTAALAVLALAVSLLAAPSTDKDKKSSNKKSTTTSSSTKSAVTDKGAQLYKEKCVSCHAPDGSGSTAGIKMGAKSFKDDSIVKASDEDLFKAIKSGKGKMPGYDKKLTDDQMKDLVAHIRMLQGAQPKSTDKDKDKDKDKTKGKKGATKGGKTATPQK